MAFDADNFKGPNGVNVAEILRVADDVEKSATFSMHVVVHDCGSAGCIMGHVLSQRQRFNLITRLTDCDTTARRKLKISDAQARQLFYPREEGAHYQFTGDPADHITSAHAAACLRKLAATGKVDWIGTKPLLDKAARGNEP